MNPFSIRRAPAHVEAAMLALLVLFVTAAAFFHATDVASRIRQTSDSAQSFVAAHAVLAGNVLLTGWRMPVDNYFTTDTLPYVALEWLFGARPYLLAAVPALIYTLLVLAATLACAFAAVPFRQKLEGVAVVAFLLGCPAWIGSWDPILFSDFHVATTLDAFVALALCALIADRGGSAGIPFAACAALFAVTAATVASDPFSLVFAFGPAIVVLLPNASLRGIGPTSALLSLVAGIAAGALLPSLIALYAHGFAVENRLLLGFTAASRIPDSMLALLCGLLNFFGANVFERQAGGGLFLGMRCLAFAFAVIATGDVAGRMAGRRRAPLFDRFLCAGIVCLIAACLLSAKFARPVTPQTIWGGSDSERYLVPAFFFSVTLAGRRGSHLIETLPGRTAKGTVRGLLTVLALIVVIAGDWPARTTEAQPRWIEDNAPRRAGFWLVRHRLWQGVGEYWSANLINSITGEAVQVRSVFTDGRMLKPDVWETDGREFGKFPQFAIWQEPNQAHITYSQVSATYRVCALRIVEGYHIAVLYNGMRPSACAGEDFPAKS